MGVTLTPKDVLRAQSPSALGTSPSLLAGKRSGEAPEPGAGAQLGDRRGDKCHQSRQHHCPAGHTARQHLSNLTAPHVWGRRWLGEGVGPISVVSQPRSRSLGAPSSSNSNRQITGTIIKACSGASLPFSRAYHHQEIFIRFFRFAAPVLLP